MGITDSSDKVGMERSPKRRRGRASLHNLPLALGRADEGVCAYVFIAAAYMRWKAWTPFSCFALKRPRW